MSLNFGKYDQLIDIKSFAEISNGNGSVTRTFTNLYTNIWAEVTPVGGSESNESDERVANISIDVKVRATGLTLNETMRIIWRGKTYNITSIDEFGSRLKEGLKIRGVAKDND